MGLSVLQEQHDGIVPSNMHCSGQHLLIVLKVILKEIKNITKGDVCLPDVNAQSPITITHLESSGNA